MNSKDNKCCEHNWQFMGAKCWSEFGTYNTEFHKIEHFFCSKCLERKEIKKSDCSRETPSWYKAAIE